MEHNEAQPKEAKVLPTEHPTVNDASINQEKEPELKNLGGRPPKWDNPIAFSNAVDEYFNDKDVNHTWTGLALHLGFASRDSLNDYKKIDGFSDPIKKALLRIERKYEEAMMRQPAGAIFALKNFGWKDKQQIEHEGIPENKQPIAPVINVYNTAPPMAESEDGIV